MEKKAADAIVALAWVLIPAALILDEAPVSQSTFGITWLTLWSAWMVKMTRGL